MSGLDLILEWESTPTEAAAEFRRLARRSRWWRIAQAFAVAMLIVATCEILNHEWSLLDAHLGERHEVAAAG
jgi:hypothetical protein